jgi:acetyl-CoA acetyltransferase
MHEVYIVSAIRTPIGRFGGGLASLSPVDLGAYAMQAALTQTELSGDALDLYISGGDNRLKGLAELAIHPLESLKNLSLLTGLLRISFEPPCSR